MLVHEISMAASIASSDPAWIERKRLLISLMKNKSVYQIQVKSTSVYDAFNIIETNELYAPYRPTTSGK
jgi:hypothetical protein